MYDTALEDHTELLGVKVGRTSEEGASISSRDARANSIINQACLYTRLPSLK